jgi:hypothetical protein
LVGEEGGGVAARKGVRRGQATRSTGSASERSGRGRVKLTRETREEGTGADSTKQPQSDGSGTQGQSVLDQDPIRMVYESVASQNCKPVLYVRVSIIDPTRWVNPI